MRRIESLERRGAAAVAGSSRGATRRGKTRGLAPFSNPTNLRAIGLKMATPADPDGVNYRKGGRG